MPCFSTLFYEKAILIFLYVLVSTPSIVPKSHAIGLMKKYKIAAMTCTVNTRTFRIALYIPSKKFTIFSYHLKK